MPTKRKILIIDDEDDFGQMVKINLEGTGHYEVFFEKTSSKALEAAQAFGPELVILDIMMRDMAGPAVAQRIKSDPRFKDIPIVFLSAAVPKRETEADDDRIGGHPYLSKPVDTASLILFLKKYLP